MNDVVIAALGVLGVVGGGGGGLTVLIKNRSSRPSGWQVAVKNLEQQVVDLRADVKDARASMEAAEAKADEVVAENQGLKATIAQQTKSLDAKDGRIVQLLTAWPPGSRPPSPNPAHEPYL